MNILRYLLLPALVLLLASCSNICRKEAEAIKTVSADSAASRNPKGPTTIQMNKSIVSAEVLDIKSDGGSNYTLTVKVLEVSEDPAYPSFASKDITYTLRPGYGVDEQGKLLKNDTNEGLLRAGKLKAGDRLEGIISMDRDMKWNLEKFLIKD